MPKPDRKPHVGGDFSPENPGKPFKPGQSGNPAGRPPHVPTAEQRAMVQAMAMCGVPQTEMELVMGFSHETLSRYYREELDTALVRANVRVAQSLFKQAIDGNVHAQKFWLMTRGGDPWRMKVEVTTKEVDAAVQAATLFLSGGSIDGDDEGSDEDEDQDDSAA